MRADLRLAPAALTVWAAAAVVVGMGPVPVLVASVLAALALAMTLLLLLRGRTGTPPTGCSAGTVVLALGGLVAVLLSAGAQLAARAPANLDGLARAGATAEVIATVTSDVTARSNPWTGAADESDVSVALDSVRARGVRTAARGPLVVTGTGSGWDAVRYGARVEVTGRLAVQGDRVLLRVDAAPRVLDPPGALLRTVDRLRAGLLDVTEGLDPQGRGLVPGVAVGDTSRLPADVDDAMRATSLTHITAVSGGHFAIVVACVAGLCVALRAPRWVRVAVTGAVSAAFVVLVHPEPSVVRSAAMGAVGLVAIALGRPSRAVAALSAAVVVLVVADPWLARSYGFVLSVAATAGLALGAAPLARVLQPWCGRVAAHAVAVPLAAQAACAPVLVLLDPSVSAYSVPANLLAAPALAPATVLGLLATLVAPGWPVGATALAWLAARCTWWIAAVARFFAALPGARVPWAAGWTGAVGLASVTVLLLGALAWWRRRWRRRRGTDPAALPDAAPRARIVAIATAAAVVLAGLALAPRLGGPGAGVPDDWSVVACDVGQGDSLVLRSGPDSAVVIDVGPPGEAADRCLDALGVRSIDLLVLSHFHADHVGGLAPVLAGRQVARALVTDVREPAAQAGESLDLLAAAGVGVQVPDAGESGTADDVRWEVLQVGATGPGPNDASIAVRVQVDGIDVVALGDLEDAGQDRLARDLAGSDDPADVVKMAHHGSARQSERLAQILHPSVVLVSSGENTYGHPTDRAMDLYRAVGADVRRTDTCGDVALVVRGGSLAVGGCG